MSKFALGIDLGSTFSSVSVVLNDKFELVTDKYNDKCIPSVVNFSKKKDSDEIIVSVGKFATKKQCLYPTNTIYDTKRMLAKQFNDENIQKMIPKWPFKIEKSKSDNILICLDKIDKKYEPYEISGEILKYLAAVGNGRLSPEEKTKDVVITIPANFGNDQRSETFKAAKYAGLNVLRIFNEPTAAGIAYGLQKNDSQERKVFVFDFGGGTLDVSLLNMKNNEFTVIATDGDMFLGGRDFDENVVEFLIKELELDENFTENRKKMLKLYENVVEGKIQLSVDPYTTIISEDGEFEEYELTLEKFEEINRNLIDRILLPVENLLSKAKLKKNDVDEIILVGGSSQMKFVERKLSEFFGKEPYHGINPVEAVAAGAGILAAKLANNEDTPISIENFKIHDICPFSIGTSDMDGSMTVFIEKNSRIPITHNEKFTTIYYRQKEFTVDVYEGEAKNVADNTFIDDFTLNLPESDEPFDFEVTFKLDENCILSVEVQQEGGGINGSKEITIMRTGRVEDDEEYEEEYEEEEEKACMKDKNFDIFYENIQRFIKMNIDNFTEVYGIKTVNKFLNEIKERRSNNDPKYDNLEKISEYYDKRFELYFEEYPKPNFLSFIK